MRRIEWTARFKRDYKRESMEAHRATLQDDLRFVLLSLAHDDVLPDRYSYIMSDGYRKKPIHEWRNNSLPCLMQNCRDSNMDQTARALDLFDIESIKPNHQLTERKKNRCELLVGDARQLLTQMSDGYFDCVVTSPPYWGLRDYGTPNQIGAEATVDDYIADLVRLFREVRRTLSNDGTLWLNIGDSYTSGGRAWRDADAKNKGRAMDYRAPTPEGLKPKDLIGVPWKLAFALQADGWYLRTDIIWNKPNCQPESVKDRPTRAHEYVFLFSKSEKYYYEWQAIMEPATDPKRPSKNRRTVWNVNTEPYPGSHFAVYPKALVRLCVLAGSRDNGRVLDPFFGSGTTGVVCNELNRECVGIELNAEYADLARERLLHRR